MAALRHDVGALRARGHPDAGGAARCSSWCASRRSAPCYCVLFSCAPGREPAEDELAAWFPRLGEITARLHRHAGLVDGSRRGSAARAGIWTPRWATGRTGGPGRSSVTDPEQIRQTQRLAEVVTARLRAFGTGAGRFGLVHADLRLANLLVDGERITVIDFEDCGLSWYLYDLACALTFNEGRADVGELIALWVDGYRQVETLPRTTSGRSTRSSCCGG